LGVALGISLCATVAGRQVEVAVRAEEQLAAVVIVGLLMLDRQNGPACAYGGAVRSRRGAHVLVELQVAVVIGVVGEHPTAGGVVGRGRKREQPLLEPVVSNQGGDVEELGDVAAAQEHHASRLLHDEQPPGVSGWRGHGERLVEVADRLGLERAGLFDQPVHGTGEGGGVETAGGVLAEGRHLRRVTLLELGRATRSGSEPVQAGVELGVYIVAGEGRE
jgi:hypothetical protein